VRAANFARQSGSAVSTRVATRRTPGGTVGPESGSARRGQMLQLECLRQCCNGCSRELRTRRVGQGAVELAERAGAPFEFGPRGAHNPRVVGSSPTGPATFLELKTAPGEAPEAVKLSQVLQQVLQQLKSLYISDCKVILLPEEP
jgi:hypothetical protein